MFRENVPLQELSELYFGKTPTNEKTGYYYAAKLSSNENGYDEVIIQYEEPVYHKGKILFEEEWWYADSPTNVRSLNEKLYNRWFIGPRVKSLDETIPYQD